MAGRTQTIGAFAASANTSIWIRAGSILNLNLSSDTNLAGAITAFVGSNNKGKLRKTGSGTLTISGSSNLTVENF
jgi:hypothetical protein